MADFEERADQLSLNLIDSSLVDGEIFKRARKKLMAPGAKLLVGPRGTGKTHLMRYTYWHALRTPASPLVLYASFNRYLHLEPLLKRSTDALTRFHSWVLAKLLLSCFQWLEDANEDANELAQHDELYSKAKLSQLVELLERGSGDELYEELGRHLTVDRVTRAVRILTSKFARTRAVLLLDDAALSLSDQYLVAFFEVFRLLKAEHVAPKAAVYPGTTQYGPTFHAFHEVEEVPLWLSVEDPDFSRIMGEIAVRRLAGPEIGEINSDALELLKYVSFGIPRAFLRLLRAYVETESGTLQQKINRITEQQVVLIGAEYDSLKLKVPQFASLVALGRQLFDNAVQSVAAAQSANPSLQNIVLGVREERDQGPLIDRMFRFLVEVGLLFPLQAVSHGPGRKYLRFIPHLAFLLHEGAFREGRKASVRILPSIMQQPASKHPVRRDLASLVGPQATHQIKLDLPPCQNCGAHRLNDSQLFCHNCGEQLVAASLFEECMKLPLKKVPGISQTLISRVTRETQLRTIGDIYSSQNAAADLQATNYVGPRRAQGIIERVTAVIDEFLS